jgi:hypothetical protein
MRVRPTQDQVSASRLLVDLAAFRIAAVLVALGVGLLFLAAAIEGPEVSAAVDSTIRELGALLFAAGVLSVFWELLGRRALTKELLDAARLSAEVQNAGLRRIAGHYLDVEWDNLLESASHVDLFFAYGRTWRTAHATPLRRLIERDGTRLRVILPDRDDETLMRQLLAKFGYSTTDLIKNIDDAEADIANFHRVAVAGATVELRRTREFPVYTYYRFDRICFVVLYSQAPGRFDVPTFECEQGGWLSGFARGQFDALWHDASVRALGEDSSA